MLRVSAQTTGTEIDLTGINGDADGAARGIPFGSELMRFGEAIALREPARLANARTALFEQAGSRVLVDAAGVAANFQRMVRIADSTGIPVDDTTSALGRDVRATLGLERFPGARNTPATG